MHEIHWDKAQMPTDTAQSSSGLMPGCPASFREGAGQWRSPCLRCALPLWRLTAQSTLNAILACCLRTLPEWKLSKSKRYLHTIIFTVYHPQCTRVRTLVQTHLDANSVNGGSSIWQVLNRYLSNEGKRNQYTSQVFTALDPHAKFLPVTRLSPFNILVTPKGSVISAVQSQTAPCLSFIFCILTH